MQAAHETQALHTPKCQAGAGIARSLGRNTDLTTSITMQTLDLCCIAKKSSFCPTDDALVKNNLRIQTCFGIPALMS
jgi:hypothetical protein